MAIYNKNTLVYFAKKVINTLSKLKRYLTADGKFVRADRIAIEYDLDSRKPRTIKVEKDCQKDASSGTSSNGGKAL